MTHETKETKRAGGPARGDLRFLRPVVGGAVPRLAFITDVHDSPHHGGYAEVILTHPYAELATDADAVLMPAVTGVPYPVVVETDLRGVVWVVQCGSKVGALGAQTIAEAGRVVTDHDLAGPDIWNGLRLMGLSNHERGI